MASTLLQKFRHMRANVLLQEPIIQNFLKCSPSEIHYNVRWNINATKTISRAKSTSLPGRVKKRLTILENKTFPETTVVEEAEKKLKANEDETNPRLTNSVSNIAVDEKSKSNLVYLQKNKRESEKTVKSTKIYKKTSSKSQQSSKVAGLSYVRKCCVYNPVDQIEDTSDLSGNYTKYKKFVDNLSLSSIPSVTAIINATMPGSARYFLNRWKRQMIEELGEEGFKEHQKKTLGLGKNLHSCIQKYLEGMSQDDLPMESDNQGHWNSLAHVLPDISDVRAVEVDVSHQTLLYHGKFDCIAKYRDMLCLIDWKTSKKSKPSLSNTFDNPIQLAAYLGAVNSSRLDVGGEYTKVRKCALVIAYPHGDPAHVHVMDSDQIDIYWDKWLDRLEYYWVLKSNNKVPAWI
ncbi:mitochondrial genome maintenance exonuclease 1-like [Pecten maximus]|uniref:mitochondrial genome maintenance exonuclease 1-like n=1 Tax=Pecten maximus TaxID=6579 RepID=UPI001458E1AA|nr:mitochondrial genome maintenance exonuclease 1-like [Pecten maximus]XP_033734607.1 mitochondrial genome maintenance exonuclease 1-like [Pecten maximus]